MEENRNVQTETTSGDKGMSQILPHEKRSWWSVAFIWIGTMICIPMLMLANRPKVAVEPVVDGMTGFIMLDKNGRPKVALHIENELRWAMKKYRKLHPDKPLPHITPHVFRHTFCTNYANAGMDIKNLQYLMGHSDAGVTLNVYTHASYSHAASQMVSLGRSWSEVPALKTAGCAAVS